MESLSATAIEAFMLLETGDTTLWGIVEIAFEVCTFAIIYAVAPAITLNTFLHAFQQKTYVTQ
jgi:ABC-type tungstate transport system substrate-binding protein